MEFKMQFVLCCILNKCATITAQLDEKRREFFLSCCFGLISITSYIYSIFPIYVHLLYKCIIGAVIMFGILLCSIEREVKPVRWSKPITVLWFMFGILRLSSGIVTSIEFIPLACIWLIAFPSIFLVWNNRKDYNVLFKSLYHGFVYPSIAFFCISILFAPIGTEAYTGITVNPNSLGQHLVAIVALVVARFLYAANKKEQIENGIIFGVIVSFAFFSRSRTATVTIAGTFLAGMLVNIIFKKKPFRQTLADLIIIIAGSGLICVSLWGINTLSVKYLPNFQHYEQKTETENPKKILNNYIDRIEGNDKHESGIENYSSGRTGIWEEVIRKLNIKGHPSRDHIITVRNGDVGNNAHNVFLQFAYDHGVFAGILFSVLYIVALFKCFLLVKEKKHSAGIGEEILLVQIAYLGLSLFTSTNLPFLYETSFVYYFTYAILFSDDSFWDKSEISVSRKGK
ncbi:O-antigen ligase family protein [Bariatricus massiliensis]|nr:O-antigen ligase family protein [Bariatricus massiliensis]MDY2663159.1 O-antigen ligase family protein [Bariatricus massiliensis]